MKTYTNYPLKHFHTFATDVYAPNLLLIENDDDIVKLIDDSFFEKDYYILGWGSNVLFLRVPENVVVVRTKGISVVDENDEFVWVKAKAGELWDDFVSFCVEQNWGGLENLSLIPGTVGASPVQNIGAYGVEVKDTIQKVDAINLITGEKRQFSNDDCAFSYRNSYFKLHVDEKWLITDVLFKLTKINHRYVLNYGNLKNELTGQSISLSTIRQKIIDIRRQKLPDPELLGNAGSFFKNPIVEAPVFANIQQSYPDMPFFKTEDDRIKIPAAWLIEKAGLKGSRVGDVGTYPLQPLVIVNYGKATPHEIYRFSETIVNAVFEKFNVKLEREVNIVV